MLHTNKWIVSAHMPHRQPYTRLHFKMIYCQCILYVKQVVCEATVEVGGPKVVIQQ